MSEFAVAQNGAIGEAGQSVKSRCFGLNHMRIGAMVTDGGLAALQLSLDAYDTFL